MMAGIWCNFFALLLSTAIISLSGANVAQVNLIKLGIANNDMALNIFRQLTAQSSVNIFFSPLSLSIAFAMLHYGTSGETAKELRRALGYDTAGLRDELVHTTFQQYLAEYLLNQDPSTYVINSANAIFTDKRFNLYPFYKRDVQAHYQALVKDVDLENQAPQVVNEINAWVKDKTYGKIDKLIDELDPLTVLVLLNAVYFKGTWKYQFQPCRTQLRTFYNYGVKSGAKNVPMMQMTGNLPHVSLDSLWALEMPYKGGNISMVILLPKNPRELNYLENTLTPEKLSLIRQQMSETIVQLTMPKFKLEFTKDMCKDFQSIGVNSAFSPDTGDFSGMSPSGEIFVSDVLHKAVIEVNEEGSEAAGATAMVVIRRSGNGEENFLVNHPFMFVIVDKRNGMILFLGRVTNL